MSRQRIDERTEKLFQEFLEHCEECKGNVHDQQTVFESWAIQKIASLQIVVELLTEKLNRHITNNKWD
jgi:hypothetical protein